MELKLNSSRYEIFKIYYSKKVNSGVMKNDNTVFFVNHLYLLNECKNNI